MTYRRSNAPRPNAYADVCPLCKETVGAREGLLIGRPGAWGARHLPDACPLPIHGPPAPVKADPTPGVYVTEDGTIVRVKLTRGSRKAVGLVWEPVGPNHSGRWDYRGRAILPAIVRPITADEAAAWGHDHDRCIFCDLPLTDDRSVAAGYGKVCAGHHGLPWGHKRQTARADGFTITA